MAGNLADALSAVVQALYKDHDVLHAYTHHPYEFGKDSLPLGLGVMGRYVAAGSWATLTDGQFAFLPLTDDGRLAVDATFTITDSAVGSTDGVNIDAGLRVSPSTWRPESLIWGVNTTGTEEAGQMERELINAILFRGLTVGGADTNGAPCVFRFDPATKRLLVDISGSTNVSYTQRYYEKVSVTNVNQAVTFIDVGTGLPFTASEITIINDDGTDAVYFNYGAAATVLTEEILAGDGYVDNFASNNVNLIANVVGPLTVRVFARA